MPNLWKYIAHPKAEPYQFTEAAELLTDEPQMPSSETAEDAEPLPEEEAALSEEPSESTDTLRYAEVQADRLLRDAKRQAEEIREQAERIIFPLRHRSEVLPRIKHGPKRYAPHRIRKRRFWSSALERVSMRAVTRRSEESRRRSSISMGRNIP